MKKNLFFQREGSARLVNNKITETELQYIIDLIDKDQL